MAGDDENDPEAIPQSSRSPGAVAPISEVQRRLRRVFQRSLDLATLVSGALAVLVAISDGVPVPLLVADTAPIIALISFAVLVGAILRGRPVWVAAIALAAASVSAGRVAPDVAAGVFARYAAPIDGTTTLKIVTANLWSRNYDARPLLKLVKDEQPDILILQEAYGAWKYYLEQLGPDYRIAAGCGLPHECNAVIVSRLATVASHQASAPCCVGASFILPDQMGGEVIDVIGLHLSRTSDQKERAAELRAALVQASSLDHRDILAGDLNALPWSTTIRYLDRRSGLKRITRFMPSWPTPQNFFPIMPIDHIYAGCGWRATSLKRGPDIMSDHYPIITTLALADCDRSL